MTGVQTCALPIFSSQLADVFDIHANNTAYQRRAWESAGWKKGRALPRQGSSIYMAIALNTTRTLDGVMEAPGGEPGHPHTGWAIDYMADDAASYKLDAFSGAITLRGTGSGVYNNAFVTCTSGCAANNPPTAITVGFPNKTPGQKVWDMNMGYKLFENTTELFFVVQNVFNTEPPLIAASVNNGYYAGQGNSEFDRIGRRFRAGVRFKY